MPMTIKDFSEERGPPHIASGFPLKWPIRWIEMLVFIGFAVVAALAALLAAARWADIF